MPDINIGRLKGGLCVYWYENGARRRYQLEASTRKEAEAEAIDVYQRHRQQARALQTVSDIWEGYREGLGDRPTGKTMIYTGKAVLQHFGALRPDQITRQHCRSYTAARREQGRSDGAIWTELGHLRSALLWAQEERIIDRAPKIERPQKPDPVDRWLELAEIRKLMDSAEAPHIHVAIALLFGTAGRPGAILDLTWDRVDFERRIIDLRVDDGKWRKGRAVVPMNHALTAVLSVAHEARLSEYVVEFGGGPVKSIRKGFSSAVRRAGLKDVTLYTLRHSAAVHMVSRGMAIEKVGQYLGHTNVAMTYKVYARFAPDHLRDAAEILEFGEPPRFAKPGSTS